jgi:transposase
MPGDPAGSRRDVESLDRKTTRPVAPNGDRRPRHVRRRRSASVDRQADAEPAATDVDTGVAEKDFGCHPQTRPPDATQWTVRTLAKHLRVSRMMVHRVWQRFDIQPHRVEKFKLSNDPQFEEKVRDIAGLYLNPPERALVLCVDEKSQIQALDRTAPILPLRPGLPERQTHDYKRHGTTTLFAAFNILNGKVIGSCLPRHRGKEFAKFLNQVEKQVPPDLEVHIILDNYSTHKSATVKRWRTPRKRRHFHFHFTPTSSSWLNQVERFFALITERMIRRGTFRSVEELESAIYAWLANWNNQPQPFVWKATADVILDKVRRCKELAGTPH